jgi:hypothetical protein
MDGNFRSVGDAMGQQQFPRAMRFPSLGAATDIADPARMLKITTQYWTD